ncbi:MAG: polysaccharide biosynthesis tyrosine autokinase [Actinobacteria bacterium]|nr:polysaccharide biosynthesis tyrosine autokinase [Actinomycetota bacterium]
MRFSEYLLVVRKRIVLFSAIFLASILSAFAVTSLMTPTYESTTRLFVSTSGTESAADLLTGNSFTQQRVKSYADIVTSPKVLDSVVAELNLQSIEDKLPDRISANVPLNTVILEITVSDPSPYRAASIANSVANSLEQVVTSLETVDPTVSSPIKLSVIQPGEPAKSPASPRPVLNLALGGLIGLALGFGVALLRENLDLRIRSVEDVPDKDGEVNVLGGIIFDETADSNPLIVHTSPKSTRAEAFRQLRTNIQFIEAAEGRKSIVVTSAIPGEGKSSTIANLAIAMADTGAKVLLVDCDLRKPKMHKYFSVEGAVGLTNLLIGQVKQADVIQRWGRKNLDLLPAGQVPPNPSELLGSEAMKNFLAQAEQDYDVVLIDSAPLLPVTDAAILSKITGGVSVVVGVGKTTKPQLAAAIGHVEAIGGRILGFIMNKIPTKGVDAYRYRYSYKYGSYGSYGAYGKYGAYGRYGAYGAYGAYAQPYGEENTETTAPASKTSKSARKTPKKA